MGNVNSKKTVYIIEDDNDILLLISLALRNRNFETIVDFNGNNFDVKRLPCPDLYIIDINLINKNGSDLCKQIKKECPDIPVILMSANVHLEEMALQANADNYLRKPLSITGIVETVSNLLLSH